MAEDPDPFAGAGGDHRRAAQEEWLDVVGDLKRFREVSAHPANEPEMIKLVIKIRLAKIAMLTQIADAEESEASAAAMAKSSNAIVFWTKVMAVVVAVQALAAIGQVIVMLCGKGQ